MATATRCRLIFDEPRHGSWNMAVDESLLHSIVESGQPVLRVYRWSEPTLSLGYFQKVSDRRLHHASRNCVVVRRHSGGGAILHDQEITYSLTLPIADRWSRIAESLYERVHKGLIGLLREWGVTGQLATNRDSNAFLCFQRRSTGDILVEDPGKSGMTHKVTGSAQRRRRSGLLQHGSLLLSQSPFAPELPGVFDLGGESQPGENLMIAVASRIAKSLEMEGFHTELTTQEWEKAEYFDKSKFNLLEWTNRR